MLNLRCFYCQTPFTVGRAELLAALQQMDQESMNHYDAHCPRCRRANSIARQRMEMAMPNWRQAVAEQMSPAASMPERAPVPPAPMPEESEPAKKPARKRAGAAKTVTTVKKPAASKAKAKPAAKPKAKPAATSSPKGKPASKSKTATKSRKK